MMLLAILGIIALGLAVINLPAIIAFIHDHLGILVGITAFISATVCLTNLHEILDKMLSWFGG